MQKVLYIFDKVQHYHVSLFEKLSKKLEKRSCQLLLLSGLQKNNIGRSGLNNLIFKYESKYKYHEFTLCGYTIRYSLDVIIKVLRIRPSVIVIPGHIGNISHYILWLLKIIFRFKIISWFCGYEYNNSKLKQMITQRYLNIFDHHLAYHTNAKLFLLNYGIPERDVTVIHNTIDESNSILVPKNKAIEYVQDYIPSITAENINVLYVGAILKEKNLELLIDSFIMLKRENCNLLIVGDGEYLDYLKNKYENIHKVFFLGKIIDKINCIFCASDVFVLTGTGGLAINEAMSYGLPVISGYADGSADDLVLNNKNGFRLKEMNIVEVTKYLSYILDNPEIREQFGKYSTNLIKNVFSFENFLSNVFSVLQKYLVDNR